MRTDFCSTAFLNWPRAPRLRRSLGDPSQIGPASELALVSYRTCSTTAISLTCARRG